MVSSGMLNLLPVLAACTPEPSIGSRLDADSPEIQSGGPEIEDVPGARPPSVAVAWETAEGTPADPTDAVFSQDWVHQVDIHLEPASVQDLLDDPYGYAIGGVTYDGVALDGVGVRLKGKIGSFRTLYGKAAFKLDFGEFGSTSTLYGLEQLTLNNNVADCSMIKTPIGYRVFALAGAKVPRVAYAWVTVNGDPYGLYTVVEAQDENWLERSYADPDGNLYDGKYFYTPPSYTLLDFSHPTDDLFQLEEGTDVGNADIHAITDALNAGRGAPDFVAVTGAVLDWDRVHPYLAAEQMMGHVDGYAMNQNNYRVYFDPDNGGLAEMLPWDLDNTLIEDWMWGMSWRAPRGLLADACWDDPACADAQRAAMADLVSAVEAVDWAAEIDRVDTLTWAFAEADPRRECWDVAGGRSALRSWMDTRPGAMLDFWGL